MDKIISNKEKSYLAVTLSGDNDKEVIKQMASALEEEGYVKDTFADAIVKRESIYPTGLPVGILDKPVTFNVMGMEGETTEVSLLFMLSIKHKEDQMGMLQKLISLCQDQNTLKEILAKDQDKINEVMTALVEK